MVNVPLGPKPISPATLGIVAWYVLIFRFFFFRSLRSRLPVRTSMCPGASRSTSLPTAPSATPKRTPLMLRQGRSFPDFQSQAMCSGSGTLTSMLVLQPTGRPVTSCMSDFSKSKMTHAVIRLILRLFQATAQDFQLGNTLSCTGFFLLWGRDNICLSPSTMKSMFAW